MQGIECTPYALHDIGAPLASFTLANFSEEPRPPGGVCRIFIPAKTLFDICCPSGALKLVSVVDSNGHPTSVLARLGCKNVSGSMTSNAYELGKCCVVAEVWPSHQAQPAAAGLSDALYAALGHPSGGCRLSIYDLSRDWVAAECEALVLCICLSGDEVSVSPRWPDVSHRRTPNSQTKSRIGKLTYGTPKQPLPHESTLDSSPNLLSSVKSKRSGTNTKRQPLAGGNASRRFTSSQGVALQDLLHGGELDQNDGQGRIIEMLELLAAQILSNRWVVIGNVVVLPFFGLNIFFQVKELRGSEVNTTVAEVKTITRIRVELLENAAATSDVSDERPGLNLAFRAAEATKDAAKGESGPAAKAAFQAALNGSRSLGLSFVDLGGMTAQIGILKELVVIPLLQAREAMVQQVYPACGILLSGPPGTGKTALARAVATEAKATFFVINGPEVVSEYLGESETCLRGIFAAAKRLSPAVVFLDEIDALAPSRNTGGAASSGTSARLVATLLAEFDALHGHAVIVVAATNRRSEVDESLRRPGRLEKEVEINVPGPAERHVILCKLLMAVKHDLDGAKIEEIARETHGYVGADLSALCAEAAMAALRRAIVRNGERIICAVSAADFDYAKGQVRPSGLRDVAVELPTITWDDVGGQDDIKQQLQEAIEWPRRYRVSLSRLGAIPPRGILLYGPPGCSKTLLAKAAAREAGLNFLGIKGPELYSKYVGETEKSLKKLFDRARQCSPCILFFDEIDGLVTSRSESIGGVDITMRVLSQLLQEMDGLQKDVDVVVIAATNRPDYLDTALLRPGRFDRLLYLKPPGVQTRRAILEVHTRGVPLEKDVDLDRIAAETDGFSGADVAALCQEAAFTALENDLHAKKVSLADFLKAANRIVPSISVDNALLEVYDKFRRRVID